MCSYGRDLSESMIGLQPVASQQPRSQVADGGMCNEHGSALQFMRLHGIAQTLVFLPVPARLLALLAAAGDDLDHALKALEAGGNVSAEIDQDVAVVTRQCLPAGGGGVGPSPTR